MKILHTSVRRFLFASALMLSATLSLAQVKMGDNPTAINPGSLLELESTNKGLLMPRISLTNTTTWGLLGTPAAGMHVYNTNPAITSTNVSYPTLAAKIGEYYWDGTGWVALAPLVKSTTVESFEQTTGVKMTLPTGTPTCLGISCATYLNWTGSFTTVQSKNDVVLDLTGRYSVASNTTQLSFHFLVFMDKTTQGTMELVNTFFVGHTATGCGAGDFNYKTVFKDLPPRPSPYTVRIYAAPWVNGGVPATLGVGLQSVPGCGNDTPEKQKLIVTVSQ